MTSTTVGSFNPTQLLDEWATCMRSHGDPDQVDPTITSDDIIDVRYPTGYDPKSQGGGGSNNACNTYLSTASAALGGKTPVQDPTKMLAFSECMRANRIPDFPDPTNTGGLITFRSGSTSTTTSLPWSRQARPTISIRPTRCSKVQPSCALRRPAMGVHPRFHTGKHRRHCQW
jgi:hypothetical protein